MVKGKIWQLLDKIVNIVTLAIAVGSLISLFVVPQPIIAGFVLLGCIAVITGLGWWRTRRHKVNLERMLIQLENLVKWEEWALIRYLYTEPIRDNICHYFLREEEYEFVEDKIILRWRLTGRIEVEDKVVWLPIKVVADVDSDLSFMALHVFDANEGTIIPPEKLRIKHKNATTLLNIPVTNPPDHSFNIHISCNLKRLGTQSEYVFFPWGQFCMLGVDTLRARVLSAKPLKEPKLRVLQPDYFSTELEPPKLDFQNNRYVLQFEKQNPKTIYILEFKIGV